MLKKELNETAYIRRVSPGGRISYSPVGVIYPPNSFSKGTWVVRVTPGYKSTAHAVLPDNEGLSVAIENARSAMMIALNKASKGKQPKDNSPKRRKARVLYEQACVDNGIEPWPLMFSMGSAWEIVDAAIKELAESVDGL